MTRLVAVLSALLAVSCSQAGATATDDAAPAQGDGVKAEPPPARATRVEVATIETSAAALELSLPGEVDGARDAMLAAALGGFVEAVLVEDGAHVKKGQMLIRVDTASHAARAAQAQVELDAAERERKRAQKLGDALPGAELDAIEARYKAAKAAAWTAQVAVGRAVITAPFAGVVVDVATEVGEVAAPGAPLVRLVQLDPAKITVSLSDRDVVAVKPGLEARVTVDARSAVLSGTIRRIQPAADPRTRSFIAEIEVENADGRLLPGMIVNARLSVESGGSELFISQDWLVTGLDKIGVFVEVDGVARFREVALGPVVRRQVVVESGLERGDHLIVTGHRELAEGDQVIVSRKGVCCTAGRVSFD